MTSSEVDPADFFLSHDNAVDCFLFCDEANGRRGISRQALKGQKTSQDAQFLVAHQRARGTERRSVLQSGRPFKIGLYMHLYDERRAYKLHREGPRQLQARLLDSVQNFSLVG